MKTKYQLSSLRLNYHFALAVSLLCACTLTPDLNPSSLPRLTQLVQNYAPGTQQIQTIDMGSGQQSGGAFMLKLKMNLPESFKTQDSESGKIAQTESNILKFRVFLYQFGGPGPIPPGILSGGNISGLSTLNKNLTFVSPGIHEQNFLIKNVPAGNFYVGIAAFNDNVIFNNTTNIGETPSSYSYSEGPCFLTNSGGDGGSNPGRVTIGGPPNYLVTGTSQLTVNLNLQDNIGAKLDTRVNLVGGTLFYTGNNGTDDDIYSVEVDGNPDIDLTSSASFEQFDPQLQPVSPFDKVVYVSTESGALRKIFKMNTDGNAQNQFTNPVGGDFDDQPDWQPNGSNIVFVRHLAANSFNGELTFVPSGGGLQTPILSSPGTNEHSPDWSSTNPRIVFISDSDGNDDIWEVNDNGTGSPLNQLRNTTVGLSKLPLYSPDGSKILFSSNATGSTLWSSFEIVTMDNNGSNQTRLTNDSSIDEAATWSPDGSKIAWIKAGNVWIMDSNGANPTQLTTTGDTFAPSWTSDGDQIIYYKGSGNTEVYMMTKDGKAKRAISSTVNSPISEHTTQFLAP